MSSKGKLLLTISILSFLALGGLFFAIRVWMPFMWFILAPAIIGFLGWVFIDHRLIGSFFNMKTTKQGLSMGALTAVVILFLAAINFVGARHYATFDFSNNSINSISAQSKKIISNLPEILKIKFFYKNGVEHAEENKRTFRELVRHYEDANSKLSFEIVEMNESPNLTKDYGATKGAGEAFIEYAGKKNRVENYTEQDFTNAVIKLTRNSNKNIYFLEGHAERSIDDEKSELSLFGFKQMLEKNSYIVKKLSLAQTSAIPEDAHVLVIAGPTQNIQNFEIKIIENYLEAGGNLFLMLDEKESMGTTDLLKKMGLELEKHYIYNVFNSPMGKVINAQAATVAAEYSTSNEITKLFDAKQMTLFRNPHSLKTEANSLTTKIEILAKTPAASAALNELESKDYNGDLRSFNIAAEVKGKINNSNKEYTAVVVSDVDFVSNILLYQNINRDFASNVISSLAKESDLISISAKEPMASKMLVSPPEFNQFFKFTVVGLFLPLPLIFMLLSLFLWLKRRHA